MAGQRGPLVLVRRPAETFDHPRLPCCHKKYPDSSSHILSRIIRFKQISKKYPESSFGKGFQIVSLNTSAIPICKLSCMIPRLPSRIVPVAPMTAKLSYPQLFSPFRVFPPNQLPPNYPIVQQYHSFRIILRCSSATTAYSAMPKPNQRFGQVIKKHPISRAIARKTGSLRFYHRAANAVFYLSYLIIKRFSTFFQ